ncbi:MAG: IS21 family transposase [Acidobacteria bacterium]|nr:IS21 family transposase [Acidobacteriota bacterium]
MQKIREVLRLHFEHGCSQRQIAAATGVSKGSIGELVRRAAGQRLTWEQASQLDDVDLERRLYPSTREGVPRARFPIDFEWALHERKRPGVTLLQLWLEYCEAATSDPEGRPPLQYSQFCNHYNDHRRKLDVTMRQTHRAGEKAFIDYSGTKLRYFDVELREHVEVELFVAVLGASNYTYVEISRSQKVADFCASTVRALEYFGGAPQILVPDQLRSAVKGPDRLDPELNPLYAELGKHYGVAIIPARPRKPRDKAKVENAVLVVQRWIVAVLRNRNFTSFDALALAVGELCERLNDRPFRKLAGCRRSLYESLDKPALSPLPRTRFEIADWKKGRVNIDYHVEYDHRVYSVPHGLVGQQVDIRATTTIVEVFVAGRRVASHRRNYGPWGTAKTEDGHRPKSHRDYGKWPPSRLISWPRRSAPTLRPSSRRSWRPGRTRSRATARAWR